MTVRADVRLGLTLFAWRAGMKAQAATGDPLARVLGRGPNADPYRRYERVRAGGDLVRSKLGMYTTASHALANTILRHPDFGVRTSEDHGREELNPGGGIVGAPDGVVHPIDDSFLSLDPPRHTRLRRLVAPWFTPRALRERTERIEKIAGTFLDEVADRDRFDLIDDYAVRVPIAVICDLLGVPDREYARFVRWGAIVAITLDGLWTMAQHRRLRTALVEMDAFFTDLIAQRRQHPGDDLVSQLVAAEDAGAGPLTVPDLLATVELLLVAGFETTVNLIGNGTAHLLRDRNARDWLLANPDRAADLVEEVLRYDPPVQHTLRIAHRPVLLGKIGVPRDTGVVVLLAGANRDPAVFERPDVFDPERPNNRDHLAFSAGIHYCLGAGLARLEAAVALRALFERYPDLSAAGPAPRRRSRNIHGVRHLPVRGARRVSERVG